MNLLIKNIHQLVTSAVHGRPFKTGTQMRDLGLIENATVHIEGGIIRWVGPSDQFSQTVAEGVDVLDASAQVALPGFVDSHTHCVYAGSREQEFAMRSEGMTYQEIAEAGGGILNSVRATREATRKELRKVGSRHLDAMMKHGTTTVEIKSGYGLTEDSEIKMMEAINDLVQDHFMTVVATFLPAHAIPPEYAFNPDAYVDLIITRMLPYVTKRRLAEFFDVFCEKGYFSVEQSRHLLSAARAAGLKLKVHADELAAIGASHLAAEMQVTSADHLEHVDDEGIRKLKEAETVAVLLPGVSFFLNHAYAPARKLIEAGVPVAIASDLNPGSCMAFSMPLMMTIACTHMGMTPEEAITATTINGAAAVGRSNEVGSIEIGKQADIVLYDVPTYRTIPYFFGANHVAKVIKRGTILEF
jgi:imidazolonepropionase